MKALLHILLAALALCCSASSMAAEESSQTLGFLHGLMDQARVADARRLDVSDRVCGAVSKDHLEALVEAGSLEFYEVSEVLDPSAVEYSRWILSRQEYLLSTRRLVIDIYAETDECHAIVWLHGL